MTRDLTRMRACRTSDHGRIVSVMKKWWDGRDLAVLLPRLFLVHFQDTSFIVEAGDEMVGFLVGFFSQSRKNEGYIHFVGIHPDYRACGLGASLYRRFFESCRRAGRDTVRSCTSPVNRASIAFHQKMGFSIEPGDGQMHDVPVTLDYNRPGDPKVQFVMTFEDTITPNSTNANRAHLKRDDF